mgnify:CR=1 FL=1
MVDVWRQAGLDVRIVVAPRKAAPGLEERSSTSMKERLREMLAAEDAAKQQLPWVRPMPSLRSSHPPPR